MFVTEIVASTPSPPATAKVSPKFTFDTVELSSEKLSLIALPESFDIAILPANIAFVIPEP